MQLDVVGADPPMRAKSWRWKSSRKAGSGSDPGHKQGRRTTDPERAAAARFTREILEKRLHRAPMGEVFEVSAPNGWRTLAH